MEKRIEIKGPEADKLTLEYFKALLSKYGLSQNFAVTGYQPMERGRGAVTVIGEGDINLFYHALNRNHFAISDINPEERKALEDLLREDPRKPGEQK